MSQEAQVQQVLDHLWHRFRQLASDGQTIDIQVWANYLAFDVVSQLGMGGPMGFIDDGDKLGIMSAVHQVFYIAASGGYIPGQMMFLQWPIVQAISEILGGPQGFKRFSEWTKRQIKNRMADEDSARPRDLLDHFISMKEPDGRTATEPSVMAEMGNLIGAGADTAAVGMAVVLGQLVEHPEDLARLRREVDEAYEALAASGEGSAELSLREMEKLPFLSACVQEATRLCPSIVWQLPREAPEEGITIAGHYIPPGATLGMSPMAHNRSKEIFGDDADEWWPQRWLPVEDQIEGKAVKTECQRRMDKFNVTVSHSSPLLRPKVPPTP
jgi:cytochrome P450